MKKASATLNGDPDGYFDPSTMEMLNGVVEEALQELAQRQSPIVEESRIELARELLAHRVMARAARGERDPERLKEHALWGF